jgi:hypothetical protein
MEYRELPVITTGSFREIETTGFDPAKRVSKHTPMKPTASQPASFFQKRPVFSIKETYSADFPHTLPAGF